MEAFSPFLSSIDNEEHRKRTEEVLNWVAKKFSTLVPVLKWNQPMFTDHDTYIIGFSVSKKHMAVAPERVTMDHFADEIKKAGYDHTNEIVRIPWKSPVDYSLLEKIIEFNILDKKDCATFWRK